MTWLLLCLLIVLLPPQAACHKERHVSQKAVSFIHDVLMEVLSSWAELPHFHFNEALFRPFEHIMQLELCDEDVQDQVNGILMPGQLLSSSMFFFYLPLANLIRSVARHTCTKR